MNTKFTSLGIFLRQQLLGLIMPILTLFTCHSMSLFANPDGVVHPDSVTYGFLNENRYANYSGIRSPLVFFLYSNLDSASRIVLFQHGLAFIAEIFFLIAFSQLISRRFLALTRWPITLLLVSPPVLSWHSVLLSESISISILLITCGLALNLRRESSKYALFSFLLAVMVWGSVKPINTILVMIIGFSWLLSTVRNTLKSLSSNSSEKRTILFVLIFLIGCTTLTINLSLQRQADFGGVDYATVSSVLKISKQNPYSEELVLALPVGSLDCLKARGIGDLFANLDLLRGECKSDLAWIEKHFDTWYLVTLVKNPKLVLGSIANGFLAGSTPISLYGSSISLTPKAFEQLFFGDRNLALRDTQEVFSRESIDYLTVQAPILIWVIFLLVSILYVGLSESITKLQLASIFAISLVSLLSPNEWFRQSIQFLVVFYLLSVISISRFLSFRKFETRT